MAETKETTKESGKLNKIRLRSAPVGLGYPQGRWIEVTDAELKRLKSYKVTPKSVLRTGNESKIKNAATPLNIETWADYESSLKD